MHKVKSTYCTIIVALIFVLVGPVRFANATAGQNFINKTSVLINSASGDASPAVTYNPDKNEYLVVYSKFAATCSGKEKLMGVRVSGSTGQILNTEFGISACDNQVGYPQVVYNNQKKEYLVVYKLVGVGSKIYYQTINANTLSLSSPVQINASPLGDPFEKFSVEYSSTNNVYVIGYHEVVSASDTKFTVVSIRGSDLGISGATTFDKNTFISMNDGIKNARIIDNAGNAFVSMQVQYTSGSEIWGGLLNYTDGSVINSFFQISPSPQPDTLYINPSAVRNTNTGEIFVVYEKSHLQISTASLNKKILGCKVNGNTGALIGPSNIAVSNIPAAAEPNEDSKLPSVAYSAMSDEYILYFYGKRWINSTSNFYDTYVQRLNPADLSLMHAESLLASSSIGTYIADNNALRQLPITYNSINNQFLTGWNTATGNNVYIRVWRYDNNPPTSIQLDVTTTNEEIPIGTIISSISITDPDPEDNSPNYQLISGTGSQDNSYFSISGGKLKSAKRLSYEASGTRSIRVKATDTHGASISNTFIITIKNIEEKPFGMTLTGPLTIAENMPGGTFSSLINVLDDDNGDTHTFSLVPGDSSDQNSNFKIDPNNNLILTVPLNYEDTSRQYVRLRATDASGLWIEKAFTIIVTDVNEKPDSLIISQDAFPENSSAVTATVQVIDPDLSSNYSFNMDPGSGGEDNISFSLQGNTLRPVMPLNYELKNSYSVKIKATDGTYDTTRVFNIRVIDENDPPDSIALSDYRIETGQPAGSLIGNLITYDQDANDNHTYEIITGKNLFFNNGDELRMINVPAFDYNTPENNRYSVGIMSTDNRGLYKTQTLVIEVVLHKDEEKPTILDFENNPSFVISNGSPLELSIKATDNDKVDTVLFYYRGIRSYAPFIAADAKQINLIRQNGLNQALVTLNTNLMDEMGIEYYFKVFDVSNNVDSTSVGRTYKAFNNETFSPTTRSYAGDENSYKIIANPYQLDINKIPVIFEDYGTSSGSSWRLFGYNNNNYNEIGNQTGAALIQGSGYWFNKVASLTNAVVFTRAEVSKDYKEKPYKMSLRRGWNLIGNPYPFELNMSQILMDHSLIMYTYQKGYVTDTKLQVFEGAFIYSDANQNIDIPLSETSNNGNRMSKDESSDSWTVALQLSNSKLTNQLGGFGMADNANDSFDSRDYPLPPRFIKYLELSFPHPEHLSGAFARDITARENNHIWEFEIATNSSDKNLILSWEALGAQLQKQQKLILYDKQHDKVLDMKHLSEYQFNADQVTSFKVLYGDESFVERELKNIKIQSLTPYPNPFNHLINFKLKLPSSKNAYSVQCHIYNMMGEKIYQENRHSISSGNYQLQWSVEENNKIKKGIYIYHIDVNNGSFVQSFHGKIIKN